MSKSSDWIRGNISKKLSLNGYNFTEAIYASNTKLSPHSHDFIYFRFVLNGNFTESFRNKEQLFAPATMMFRSSDESHSNQFHTNTRCFSIKLKRQKFREIYSPSKTTRKTVFIIDQTLTSLFTRLYNELYTIDEFSKLTIEGLMLEIIGKTFRQIENKNNNLATPPVWLLRVKSFLDEEFKENTSINYLADIAQIHPTHLAGEFRRYFQMTIGDYVRIKRIEFVRQKLVSSKIPISEIALMSGFFDQSHLTRIFKKVTGMTPAVFRTNFKSN